MCSKDIYAVSHVKDLKVWRNGEGSTLSQRLWPIIIVKNKEYFRVFNVYFPEK